MTAKTILRSTDWRVWQSQLFEPEIGRMRPAYYLYFVVVYLVFGPLALGFWLAQAVVVLLTLIGLRKLIKIVSPISDKLLIPALAAFLFMPAVVENTYRLGTAEPRQALFMVWLLVWLARLPIKKITAKEFFIGNGLLLLTLTTKETSILLLPLIAISFVWMGLKNHLKKPTFWILGLTLLSQVLLFFVLMPRAQGYATSLSLSWSRIWLNIHISRLTHLPYYFLLGGGLGLSLSRWWRADKLQKVKQFWLSLLWPVIFLLGFTMSLFFVFTWEYQLERYYYLPVLFLWVFSLGELGWFFQSWHSFWQKHLWRGGPSYLVSFFGLCLVVGIALMPLTHWPRALKNRQEHLYGWLAEYTVAGELTAFLQDSVPSGTQIFLASDNYEIVIETGFFASRLGDQPVTVYSQNQDLARYRDDIINAYQTASSPKLLLIKSDDVPGLSPEILQVLKPTQLFLSGNDLDFWRFTNSY